MIWIIGEYSDRIENANVLLESFLENFSGTKYKRKILPLNFSNFLFVSFSKNTDESTTVQLQLLTAVVKLFLKRPKDAQEMVQKVLNLATQETDNPVSIFFKNERKQKNKKKKKEKKNEWKRKMEKVSIF